MVFVFLQKMVAVEDGLKEHHNVSAYHKCNKNLIKAAITFNLSHYPRPHPFQAQLASLTKPSLPLPEDIPRAFLRT